MPERTAIACTDVTRVAFTLSTQRLLLILALHKLRCGSGFPLKPPCLLIKWVLGVLQPCKVAGSYGEWLDKIGPVQKGAPAAARWLSTRLRRYDTSDNANPGTLRSADTDIEHLGVAEWYFWFLPPPPVFNLNVHVGGGWIEGVSRSVGSRQLGRANNDAILIFLPGMDNPNTVKHAELTVKHGGRQIFDSGGDVHVLCGWHDLNWQSANDEPQSVDVNLPPTKYCSALENMVKSWGAMLANQRSCVSLCGLKWWGVKGHIATSNRLTSR